MSCSDPVRRRAVSPALCGLLLPGARPVLPPAQDSNLDRRAPEDDPGTRSRRALPPIGGAGGTLMRQPALSRCPACSVRAGASQATNGHPPQWSPHNGLCRPQPGGSRSLSLRCGPKAVYRCSRRRRRHLPPDRLPPLTGRDGVSGRQVGMDGDNMFRKIPTPPSSPSSHELSFSSARIESAIVFQPTSPSSTHRLSPTAQPTPSPRCRRPASCTSWSTAPSFFGIRRSTPLQPRPTRPALCLARPWPCCSAALAAAPPMLFHHPLAPTANVPEEWRATDPARA